ncbi:MAG: hypothetical protein Q4F45_02860 [Alistipes sp.]|nr:hypothetical protein [Alistipes sp.]
MKRLLLLIIATVGIFTCYAQKSKSFYYEGIEFHNTKGWSIQPSKDGNTTFIFGIKGGDQFHIYKQKITEQTQSIDTYLNKIVEQTTENNFNTTGKQIAKIKEVGDIMEGYINALPVKYVDIAYTKKINQRIYAMYANNCLYTIICTVSGDVDDKLGKILSTLTFTPESNTNRLL